MDTAILIDNMYFEHICSAYGCERVDYTKIPDILLRNGEKHFRTFVFDALPFVPDYNALDEQKMRKANKKSFLDKLQYLERIAVELGEVRPKRTKCYNCKNEFYVPIQKLVDVKISVRLTSLAWMKIVNRIILVSGDADLIPAVEAINGSGTTVRLAYAEVGSVRTSKSLIRACPEKSILTEGNIKSCLLELK